MDLRWAGDDINRLRALAQELVGLQPDIILANGTAATAALQQGTRTIPIVFAGVSDPVQPASSRSSVRIIARMLSAPRLPLRVRRKILEYLAEKTAGLYGDTGRRPSPHRGWQIPPPLGPGGGAHTALGLAIPPSILLRA
jgi:hypothetical protein